MKTSISILLVLSVALTAGASNEPTLKKVAVRWATDLPSTGSDKGVAHLEVADPAGDCLARYAITGVSTWRVMESAQEGVLDVRSGISISIRKLFEGQSPVPEIAFVQVVDELTIPAIFSFSGTRPTQSKSWVLSGAEHTGVFDAMNLSGAETWQRLEIRCR